MLHFGCDTQGSMTGWCLTALLTPMGYCTPKVNMMSSCNE